MTNVFDYTPANDNCLLLVSDTGPAREAIARAFNEAMAGLRESRYDDALLLEGLFTVMVDQIYRSNPSRWSVPHSGTFERYNQVSRFAGELAIVQAMLLEHYCDGAY